MVALYCEKCINFSNHEKIIEIKIKRNFLKHFLSPNQRMLLFDKHTQNRKLPPDSL